MANTHTTYREHDRRIVANDNGNAPGPVSS
jgi:hypothetical protein